MRGGGSTRARPSSCADLAAPLIQLEEEIEVRVPEGGTLPTLNESELEHWSPQGECVPNLGHTFVPQQNFLSEGCNFGTATANSWQETNVVVENVVNIAEERHQEVMLDMTSTTNENHQQASNDELGR